MNVSTLVSIHWLLYQHHVAIMNEEAGQQTLVQYTCCCVTSICVAVIKPARDIADSCYTNKV